MVRVRFAPSPTGYLHVGGLRTALFNYLYTRSQGGKFILRIEDTDRSRYVEGALENLLKIFSWLGLEFDEGPHLGGDYAPYIQSQRLQIYRRYAEQLLSEGSAYRCFCSPERLEEVRRVQQSSGKPPMYDRKCRAMPSPSSDARAEKEPFVIRLKMPLEVEIRFQDGIRGTIKFEAEGIDDQVLIKSDGYPTYHLANVVDDHLMEITDVIRGEEWLPSTPKHIQIYSYLGWQAPKFHHLPLLLNPDRSKLSKRQGDVAVEDYRALGYLPEALINYTALLGWHPADEREFFTLTDLVKEFSLERVTKAGGVFDPDKLNWVNRLHLNTLSDDDFLLRGKEFIPSGFDFATETGKKVLHSIREGLERYSDLQQKFELFAGEWERVESKEASDWLESENSQRLFITILDFQSEITYWNPEIFKDLMKKAGSITGLKGPELWMPVRVALTGKIHGPELVLIAEALGKDKFFNLIRKVYK
jgi:glutamyl-tRNA synthetase